MFRKSKSPLAVLIAIRAKLADLIERASADDTAGYLEISNILQRMYCPGKSKPLITTTSDAIGLDILVAIHYSPEEEVEAGLLPSELTGHMHPKEISNVVTWLTCGHALVDILEAADRKEVNLGGRELSYNQLINMAVQNLPAAKTVLGSVDPSSDVEAAAFRTISDIARTSVKLIDLIEDKITNNTHSPHFRKRKNSK